MASDSFFFRASSLGRLWSAYSQMARRQCVGLNVQGICHHNHTGPGMLSGLGSLDAGADAEATQSPYLQRLQKDIARTQHYIHQADAAIAKLEAKLQIGEATAPAADAESHLQLKKDTIAKFEAYRRLAYTVDGNDVIGVATACSVTDRLVQEQQRSLEQLTRAQQNQKLELNTLRLNLADYRQISTMIDEQIELKRALTEELERKIDHIRSHARDDGVLTTKLSKLDDRLSEAEAWATRFRLHLQYILNDHGPLAVSTVRQLVAARLHAGAEDGASIIQDDGGWCAFDGGADGIVNVLLMHNLIETRDDDGGPVYRLREYGQ